MSSFSISKIACPHPAPSTPPFDECSYNKLTETCSKRQCFHRNSTQSHVKKIYIKIHRLNLDKMQSLWLLTARSPLPCCAETSIAGESMSQVLCLEYSCMEEIVLLGEREGRKRKALLLQVPHGKKIYQNLFAQIVIVTPPVAMIIKLHHQLSWLGPAAGVQGWHWPQSEFVSSEGGSCSFAASVKLIPQWAFLHLHHPSSSLLLGERLGSTSGLAPSRTGARGQKLLFPTAGKSSSSGGGKALVVWILGLLGSWRNFLWTAGRIKLFTQGGGRDQI